MIQASIERLDYLCQTIPALLHAKSVADMEQKPDNGGWSKKEIMGHLIDSATNNHQRFVRAQFEQSPAIGYDSDLWNEHNYYQLIDTTQIISLWTAYNKQLAALLKHIPETKLQNKVTVGSSAYTLQFVIEDYVVHMEHHLKEIVTYS